MNNNKLINFRSTEMDRVEPFILIQILIKIVFF